MKKWVQIVLIILFHHFVSAQKKSGYLFDRWNSSRGFPFKSVGTITQSQDGKLWMVTDKGISCFDGFSSRNYSPKKDSSGLLPFVVHKIFIDRSGIIWISYRTACISKFDPISEKFTHFYPSEEDKKTFDDPLANNYLEDKKGNLWIASWGGGLLKMDKNKGLIKRFLPNKTDIDCISTNEITSICELNDGRFMIGCWEGGEFGSNAFIGFFDPITEKFKKLDLSEFTFGSEKAEVGAKNGFKIVHNIYQEKNGILWVATFIGLFKVDLESKTVDRLSTNLQADKAVSDKKVEDNIRFCIFVNDEVWAATEVNGIIHFNKQTLQPTLSKHQYTDLSSISSDRIKCLFKDKDDNIWVSTTAEGIDVFSPLNQEFKLLSNEKLGAEKYNRTQSLITVSNIDHIHSEEKIYFSHGNGYSIYDPKSDSSIRIKTGEFAEKNLIKYKLYPASSSYATNGIVELKDQLLIKLGGHVMTKNIKTGQLGFMSHHFLYSGLTYQPKYNNILSYVYVPKSVYFEKNRKGKYLVKIDPSTLKVYDTILLPRFENQNLDESKDAETFSLDDNKWLITRNRFSFLILDFPTNKLITLSPKKPFSNFPDSMIKILTVDHESKVWITGNGGLYRFDPKTLKCENLTEKYGLKEKPLSVTEDKDHIFWIAMKFDLLRLDIKEGKIFTFNKFLGLNTGGFVELSTKQQDMERVYIPGLYGVVHFDPKKLILPKRVPSLFISQIEINKDTLSVIETGKFINNDFELSWKENNLVLEYATDQYYSAGARQFSYRLSGKDTSWTKTTSNRAVFSNLPPGKYLFELRSKNIYGVESAPLQLTFIINKPFWQTWWFRISVGLVIVTIIIYYIKWRELKLKERQKELEMKIHEATYEIKEQKHLIEEKQKEILDSINYAKRIQYTLLAHDEFLKENLSNHFTYFNPKDIVSGDFYWAAKQNDKFYLAVCDSTGHGVPGAFMSLLNIGFLSEAINEKGIEKPNEIIEYVRMKLTHSISKEGQKDGFDGILICIDKNKFTYTAANNRPILIRDGNLLELEADRMPVGVGERKDNFKLQVIDAKPGDVLYLYTDGYADQFGGPKGKKFKYKQLNELLLSIHRKSMEEQKELLRLAFENWRGNLEQVDDVTIIGVRV